ncbi:GntR family transcriptional regulator [Microbacterium pseudoresistens]|uniref:DNA-binding GntR family transcriptional regulator n=1 Tax=Microbacterium pseudoresistens TaxID=640634 RepID=A0A7Y9EUK1_9MICO|nr:GntR family transcriptional regulator [Microbacterium pseudoresistens]NYD53345.1 DNA-binding GntR family transcriptional regulator [Microbacterium pseudoresistens]
MGSTIRPIGDVPSIRDEVERLLAAAIISGELEPAQLVTAPNLATRFEVSATPVREAMINLEKRGLVESVRYKGFRIRGMDDSELREIVEVRQWLEGPAMALVARGADRERIGSFRERADDIVAAALESDLTRFLDADHEFHLGLLRLAGNARLLQVVTELRGKTRLVGLAGMSGTDELRTSADEHHTLLDLLLSGDGEGADLFMRRHIAHVLGWWSGKPES